LASVGNVGNFKNWLLTPAQIRQRWNVGTLAGAGLVFVAALIYVVLGPEHFEGTPYLGALAVANFIGAMAAATGICIGAYWRRRWGWAIGVLVAAGALVTHFAASTTLAFPGAGAIAKVVEALFLMIVAFWVAGSFTGFWRWVLLGGIAAVVVVPVLAVTLGFLAPGQAQTGPGLPVKWKATSPATKSGDQYSLLLTNTSNKDQRVGANVAIKDHSTKTSTTMINKEVELAPGEERELTAVNDYGRGMHFMTQLGSQTQDLNLLVKLTDSSGKETAQYDQGAFLVQQGKKKA
jgi:hypothetical protein